MKNKTYPIQRVRNSLLYILQSQRIQKLMAFVFSSPRWVPQQQNLIPGPGSYFQNYQDAQKSPQNKSPKIKKGLAAPKEQKKVGLSEITNCIQAIPRNNRKPSRKQTFPPKVSKYTKRSTEQTNINGKHFFEVSSLTPKLFIPKTNLDIAGSENFAQYGRQRQYFAFRTPPSIQQTATDKFYIGSNVKKCQDELKAQKNSKSMKIFKGLQLSRSFSPAKEQQNNLWDKDLEKLNQNISGGCRKAKTQKPLSAKHPLRKREDLMSAKKNINQSSCTNDGPTKVCEDDEESQFEDEAFPGPGQYSPKIYSKTTKKGYMFTEKNKQRFTTYPREYCRTDFYGCQKQKIKKFSRASQKKVGFGSTIGKKLQKKVKQQRINKGNFYQNYGTIEYKNIKNEIQNRLKPGFFISKQPRFKQQRDLKEGDTLCWQEELKNKETMEKKINQNIMKYKKTPCFKSNQKRVLQYQHHQTNSTKNIDFLGQNYKTVGEEVNKIKERVQITQDFDIAFNTAQDRFQEKHNQNDKNRDYKSYIQVKHQLIDDFYGFRKRPSRQKKQGYSFSKMQRMNNVKEMNEYGKQEVQGSLQMRNQWIKHSFNKNFVIKIQEDKENKK